jgi:hypothetical protein
MLERVILHSIDNSYRHDNILGSATKQWHTAEQVRQKQQHFAYFF